MAPRKKKKPEPWLIAKREADKAAGLTREAEYAAIRAEDEARQAENRRVKSTDRQRRNYMGMRIAFD